MIMNGWEGGIANGGLRAPTDIPFGPPPLTSGQLARVLWKLGIFPDVLGMFGALPSQDAPAVATAGYKGDLAAVRQIPGLSSSFRQSLRSFARRLPRAWRYEMVVTSALRDEQTNTAVGGVPNSLHLTGDAVDVLLPVEAHTDGGLAVLDAAAKRAKVRVLVYPRHLHIDLGGVGLQGAGRGPAYGFPLLGVETHFAGTPFAGVFQDFPGTPFGAGFLELYHPRLFSQSGNPWADVLL